MSDASAEFSPAQTGCRVLLVDDGRDACRMLRRLLELEGHKVRVAHDGNAAVESAKRFQPEAALLDIGLPDINGYELARRLRSLEPRRETMLIALTGRSEEGDQRRAREAGFRHFLTKPVDIEQLLAILPNCAATAGE